MKLHTIFAAAALAASMAAGAASATELVQNGGFETGDFTSWNESGWFLAGNYAGVAATEGAVFATTGCVETYCTLSQDLATVAGQSYTLTFDFNPGQSVAAGGGSALIQWNGVTLEDLGVGDLGWTTHSYTVQASGATSTLTFAAFQDPAYNGVDAVSVTETGGGVPEPATWAMMLSGFVGAGAALRARRRVAVAA